MLFKSNKFFDLKSNKALVKLFIQKLLLLKTCDYTVKYWQPSINLCQFFICFFFFLHVTGKSYHFFKFNYLEICFFFLVYLTYMKKLRYITVQDVPFLEFYIPRFCGRHIFFVFLTKHLGFPQFLLFCNGTFTIFMLNVSI